jgi:phosphoribosyl 1,2-cyclic phosphate phosphodiesterase
VSDVEVIVLGSGTSHGVPMIGCRCAVCSSNDSRDRRTRAGLFVRFGPLRLLIDAAPELRLQCIANGIDGIDAVLFTHSHADHVLGIDDLRRFNWLLKRAVPCYGSAATLSDIRRMFAYAFEPAPGSPHSRPQLELIAIDDKPFRIGEMTIVPIPLMHGPMPVLGFRFGRFAYCTDCNEIPPSSVVLLERLDVLILDALRKEPHPAHFTLDEAVRAAGRIGAKRTYFTHMTHQLPHAATNRELPQGMELAFDGLRLTA